MTIFPIAVSGSTKQESDFAQEAAQYCVNTISTECEGLSQWKDALAALPQPYENLEGEINAYMFAVIGNTGVVGHILVGSSLYDYDLLEAGEAAPPVIPSVNEIYTATQSIGIKVEKNVIEKPVKLLYLGLDSQYAVYSIDNQQIAINLVFKKACMFSNLINNIPTSTEYHRNKSPLKPVQARFGTKTQIGERTSKTLSGSAFNYLTMYYYNDIGSDRVWCGPCSGVSILNYFRDYKGYSNVSSNTSTLYDSCYTGMHCAQHNGYAYDIDYGDGILETVDDYGYTNFNAYLDTSVSFSDYESVVNDIQSGWPTALLICAQTHWRAIKGYSYNTNSDYYRAICTNSQTSDNWEYVNWLTMGYWNETVAIKDNG